MSEVSRALALEHYDRAFVLLTERGLCAPTIAAAFLLQSGVAISKLPLAAMRAIASSAIAA